MTATRFFDRITNEYRMYTNAPQSVRMAALRAEYPQRKSASSRLDLMDLQEVERDRFKTYSALLRILEHENTKRLLFDSRQAAIFHDIDEEPPDHVQSRLHAPFDQFYLEFTEPIEIGSEPGHRDLARAFLIGAPYATVNMAIGNEETRGVPIRNVTLFLTEDDTYVDRTWMFNLETGWAFTRALRAIQEPDPSEIPAAWQGENDLLIANRPIASAPDRHIGWWERMIDAHTALLSWILTYLMAKSITIAQEPESRQVRRWREARNLPNMWHVVKVEPKFYTTGAAREGEPAYQHSYRYDVIGHLRFGRHKTRDGYSETIEWVPPHQRGLANELYIPKTYKVESGKVVSPRMAEYFKEPAN